MAENESSGGLSLEALLAAARGASASDAAAEPEQESSAAAATPAEGSAAADASAPSATQGAVAEAPAEAEPQAPAQDSAEPATEAPASSGGFDLAAALGYGSDVAASLRRPEGASHGSAVATGSFDLAAALGYAPASPAGPGAAEESEPARPKSVNPAAIAEAVVREEQAQAAAEEVAREAIARAAREEGTPHFRSRYADLPHRSTRAKDEAVPSEQAGASTASAEAQPDQASDAPAAQGESVPRAEAAVEAVAVEEAVAAPAEDADSHRKAVSRMASASARAAEAAVEARKAASSVVNQGEAERAPVTFQPLREAAGPSEAAPVTLSSSAEEDEDVTASLEAELASQEPAFISVQEAADREAQRQAEEAAAAEERARLEAERAAQEESARLAAAQKAAADRAQAEAVARSQAQARAPQAAEPTPVAPTTPVAPMPTPAPAPSKSEPVRPRKAAVTAKEEVMVEPLPMQQIGTISYEDAVYADEMRQTETAAERKAAKKARRYRRFGVFLIIVALLCAAGAVALFFSGTAGASEDIETKAAEISETAGRTITYRYRAADANGTLCPTTEVATFSTGGTLEQSVITMQTADFETAGHTLAYFKKQFQDSSYVDGRVDNNSVVFTLHLSSEHLMKSTYTALVMSNTVGCEVII